MKLHVYLMVALSLIFMNPVFAEDKSGGCGLGWMVTKKHSLLATTSRATTNGLFGNQTFGMTSGTSGCARHSIVKVEKEQIHFAEANFFPLQLEMAQGKGEYLEAFARTLGCSESQISHFGQTVKGQYDQVVTEELTPKKLLHNVKNVVEKDPTLSASCGTAV